MKAVSIRSTGDRLAGLRAYQAARRRDTVARLKQAIADLKKADREITAQSIYEVSGLHYRVISRNKEAYRIFERCSTGIARRKHRARAKGRQANPASRLTGTYTPLEAAHEPASGTRAIEDATRPTTAGARDTDFQGKYLDLLQQQMADNLELDKLKLELRKYRDHLGNIREKLMREEQGGGNMPAL